jgi:hypothetical protein
MVEKHLSSRKNDSNHSRASEAGYIEQRSLRVSNVSSQSCKAGNKASVAWGKILVVGQRRMQATADSWPPTIYARVCLGTRAQSSHQMDFPVCIC